MKLVIDIPEEVYKDIQSHDWKNGERWYSEEWKAIHNGTPLDKIRAEIEQTAKDYDKFADYRRVRGLWIALDIIDKYKAESEE